MKFATFTSSYSFSCIQSVYLFCTLWLCSLCLTWSTLWKNVYCLLACFCSTDSNQKNRMYGQNTEKAFIMLTAVGLNLNSRADTSTRDLRLPNESHPLYKHEICYRPFDYIACVMFVQRSVK